MSAASRRFRVFSCKGNSPHKHPATGLPCPAGPSLCLRPMPQQADNSQRPPAVAIVVSRYNASITDRLMEGPWTPMSPAGGTRPSSHVFDAPGSFELPGLALAAAETGRYRGVVALGCLIRGETRHDRYIAEAVAHGLVHVSMNTGVPCGFGVLTVESREAGGARPAGTRATRGRTPWTRCLTRSSPWMRSGLDGLRRPALSRSGRQSGGG